MGASISRSCRSARIIRGSGRIVRPSKRSKWQMPPARGLSCPCITKHSASASNHCANRSSVSKMHCARSPGALHCGKSARHLCCRCRGACVKRPRNKSGGRLSHRHTLVLAQAICGCHLPARADVAQLVEQRFRKPQVTGSNPVVGSTNQMSNTDSSVSIIVPTLNEAENIAPLVSQIIASAAPFREILFIDNNSTDASRDMIRVLAASHPIRLIEQDHAELGLSAAIISGALAAQGEIHIVI